MVIDADHVAEYLTAVATERKKGKEYLLAFWDAGHTFRKYNDNPADIAASIGKSPAYVTTRIKVAGAVTRAKLAQVIDKDGVATQQELLTALFGWQSQGERTRRGIHVPLPILEEAQATDYDVVGELKWFLSEIRLSQLRPILAKFRAEHLAAQADPEPAPAGIAHVPFIQP